MKYLCLISILFVLKLAMAGSERSCGRMNLFTSISNLSSDLTSEFCKELKIGESRQVSLLNEESPTTVDQKYQIKRISNKKYQVTFKVNFTYEMPPGTYTHEELKRIQEAEGAAMEKQVNSCFKDLGDKLQSSDGETIDLRLERVIPQSIEWTEKEGKIYFNGMQVDNIRSNGMGTGVIYKRTGSSEYEKFDSIDHKNTISISIVDKKRRVDAENFSKNMDCATITHEFMHHLGLVDEYEEDEMGRFVDEKGELVSYDSPGAIFESKYNCRTIGPVDSVMVNQWASLGSSSKKTPKEVRTYQKCQCEGSCWKIKFDQKERDENKICPPPHRLENQWSEYGSQQSQKKYPHFDILINGDDRSFFILNIIKPNGSEKKKGRALSESILYPAHFRHILYPGCYEKNALYYSCARNSKADKKAGGCFQMDSRCGDENGNWLK